MLSPDRIIDHILSEPTCLALNSSHGQLYAIANSKQVNVYRTTSSKCVQAIAITNTNDQIDQISAMRFHSASKLSINQSFNQSINPSHSDELGICNGSNLFIYDLSSQSHPLTTIINATNTTNDVGLTQRIDEFSWSSCHPNQLATIGAHRASKPYVYDTRQPDLALHVANEHLTNQSNDISNTIPAISSVLIAYHPTLSQLLACVHHNLVQVFDLRMIRNTSIAIHHSNKQHLTGPMKSFCSPLSSAIQSIDWNPFDDRQLMTGNIAQQLQFWHLDSDEPINRCQYSIQSLNQTNTTPHPLNSTLRAAVFAPWQNGLISLSSSGDANIRVWSFGTERSINTLPNGHNDVSDWFNAECVAVLDGGDAPAIGLEVLRPSSMNVSAARYGSVAFGQSLHREQQIWALGDDKRIRIWNVRDDWIKACHDHITSARNIDEYVGDIQSFNNVDPHSVEAINDELKRCSLVLSDFHFTPVDAVSRTSHLTLASDNLSTSEVEQSISSHVPAVKLHIVFPSTYPSASPCFILNTESPSLLKHSKTELQTDILYGLSHLAYEHTISQIDQLDRNQSGCLIKCLSWLQEVSVQLFNISVQRSVSEQTLCDSPLPNNNSDTSPSFEPDVPPQSRKTVRIRERARSPQLSLSVSGRRGIASASTPALSSLITRANEYNANSSQPASQSSTYRPSSSLSGTPDYIEEDEENDSFDDQLLGPTHLNTDSHMRRTQSNPIIKPSESDEHQNNISSHVIIHRSKAVENAINEQLPCPSLMSCCWGPQGQLIVVNQPIQHASHSASNRPHNYAQFLGLRHSSGSKSVHSTPVKTSNALHRRESAGANLQTSDSAINQTLDFDSLANELPSPSDIREISPAESAYASEYDSEGDTDLIDLDEVPLSALTSITGSSSQQQQSAFRSGAGHSRGSSLDTMNGSLSHNTTTDRSSSPPQNKSIHHTVTHLDKQSDVPYQIHPRERDRALQQSIRHSLLMVDMSCLFPVDLALAAEYSMNATSPLELALNNQACALERGRIDLARVWHLVALIIESDQSIAQSVTQPKQLPFASLSPWSASQLGGALANQLMSDLFRTGDFQSVGLIACALQIHENQVKHRKINYTIKQQQLPNQPTMHPSYSLTPSHSEPVLTLLAPVITSRAMTSLPSSLYHDRLNRHVSIKRPASTPSVAASILTSTQPAALLTSMRRSHSGNAASSAASDYSASSRDERSPRFETGSVPTPTNMRFMRPRAYSPNTYSEVPSPQPATPLSPVSIGASTAALLNDANFISVRVSRTDLYKLCYAEFLHRAGLYVFRAWVLKLLSPALLADEASTSSLIGYMPFQSSVGFSCTCEHCGSQTDSLACHSCSRLAATCAICDSTVQGHAMYCQKCGHGGHPSHIQEWFAQPVGVECPRGCGCRCVF